MKRRWTGNRHGMRFLIAALIAVLPGMRDIGFSQRAASAVSSARFSVVPSVNVSASLKSATDDPLEYRISGPLFKEVLVGAVTADDLVWYGLASTDIGSNRSGRFDSFGDAGEFLGDADNWNDRASNLEQNSFLNLPVAEVEGIGRSSERTMEALALVIVFPGN